MKQDDLEGPPDTNICFILSILVAVVFFIMGVIIGGSFSKPKKYKSKEATSTPLSVIQGNTILTYSNPSTLYLRILVCKETIVIKVIVSEYNSVKWQTDGTPLITADGTRVHPGIIACNWLPFHTIVKINGNYYEVEDRMNRKYGKPYIDIWSPSLKGAKAFGRKSLEVEIIK